MCVMVETMTGFICAECDPDCECVVCRPISEQCADRYEPGGEIHSDDRIWLYDGHEKPTLLCGFHAQKRGLNP